MVAENDPIHRRTLRAISELLGSLSMPSDMAITVIVTAKDGVSSIGSDLADDSLRNVLRDIADGIGKHSKRKLLK